MHNRQLKSRNTLQNLDVTVTDVFLFKVFMYSVANRLSEDLFSLLTIEDFSFSNSCYKVHVKHSIEFCPQILHLSLFDMLSIQYLMLFVFNASFLAAQIR